MRVSFISAFDTDKDIGGEYNRLIENIHDEWIFIRDGDCMFLTPDYGKRISDIIEANKDAYDVIGFMTNRLNLHGHTQRVEGMDKIDSITDHIDTCERLWKKNGTTILDAKTNPVAAMCMAFKREVWEKKHFFPKSVMFDSVFCEYARRNGYKVGVAKGMYVLHLYRWKYKENPQDHFDHLK